MKLNAVQFTARTAGVRMEDKTRRALFAIMVEGQTWRQAEASNGITRSGILRAMRRLKTSAGCCPTCGRSFEAARPAS